MKFLVEKQRSRSESNGRKKGKREFLADATGALLTRYPEGLASALEKISAYSGKNMKRANHATAHLFIASPFSNKKNG